LISPVSPENFLNYTASNAMAMPACSPSFARRLLLIKIKLVQALAEQVSKSSAPIKNVVAIGAGAFPPAHLPRSGANQTVMKEKKTFEEEHADE
jgi:hypothetical protein